MLEPIRISDLSSQDRRAVMTRSTEDVFDVFDRVREILTDVRDRGDAALLNQMLDFEADYQPADLVVSPEEIKAAYDLVSPEVIDALKLARDNIARFHKAQLERPMWTMENSPGVLLGRMTTSLDRVGCYAPGGLAAYPSSVLMTVIPAKTAGVEYVCVATPPKKGMTIPPAILVAADLAGADQVLKLGGPWAVAGLAYGTETVPKVDKIVGPGNKYVTAAKLAVFGQVDIDSPAGPSESLIIVDRTARPEHVALDMLSQAEHDPDSAAVVVSTSPELAGEISAAVKALLPDLPRQDQLSSSLGRRSALLIADDLDQAIAFTNEYAPEHLQIITVDPWTVLPRIRHAGSIFLGPNAPVPVGDYCSGTNHVLPTGQAARAFSGLSVDDFLKKSTFQYLSDQGLASIRKAVTTLAGAEGLPIHAMSVNARFKD